MDRIRGVPAPLLIAAAALLIEEAGLLSFYSSTLASCALAILGVTVAAFLLSGSQVARALALALAISGLVGPFVWNEPLWVIVTSAAVLVGLLHPASRSYFEDRKALGHIEAVGPLQRAYGQYCNWTLRVGAGISVDDGAPAVKKDFLLRFAILFGLLFVAVGGIRELHLGAGQNSQIVDVLWSITWPLYTIVKVVFLIALAIAGVTYVKDRWNSRHAARH